VEIGVLSPAASGSRYDADFGVYFWTKGEEAQVAWPQENQFTCAVSK
jgi:membrane-bound inhibitor of C-type lysozyme